ncbi:superfamily II DNA/RNA helicase [Naumannella cuiyingiana]|uniref:RNA helicase n=2 Tax=Naumannella cuiyingiana TaxID=1347891 RepID=A0A7Z0IJS3_9ACTN|nr:superfamily II DNA/RNA helicase [Naumannella cuiyingiana]
MPAHIADGADAPAESGTTDRVPPSETFADLGVHPDIVAALDEVGISHPFPIQHMAIPIAITGTDMIGQARTGTGKTLAFGVTLLQRIVVPGDRDADSVHPAGKPQALVICPTRELASQVAKDLQTAAKVRAARILTVYGGVGYEPQLDALAAGVDVVVGTPGRLLDLANRRALDLSHVKVAVLDEADEMLDLGFLPDVEKLLAKTPELRQTLLFSATMPSQIVTLARRHLRHPVNIRAEHAGENQTVPATAQFVYQAHDLDKPEVVARILQAEGRDRAIIFCRTKRSAQRVADDLAERGFAAAPIHGDLTQVSREKALKRFREGGVDVLVATDVAARGIDVGGVTHVINYECPDDDKTYVHRIGRTGRAGKSGVAITFVDWADLARWKMINKTLGLPFEQPQETYSTSEHLFHDLGIPSGTKGRLVPEKPRERRDEGRERPREERPRRSRNRRRTRNGEPVSGRDGTNQDGTNRDETHHDGPGRDETNRDQTNRDGAAPVDAATTDRATDEAGEGQRRRRRRRGGRGRGRGAGGDRPAESPATSSTN